MSRQHSPPQNLVVEVVVAGIILGEIGFSVLYSPAEDYWQHYNAARSLLAWAPIVDYSYPAAAAVLFIPFSLLPARLSYVAWVLTTYIIFAVALYLFRFSRRNILIWLAWPHVLASAFVGQLDCFVLLAVALSNALRKSKPFSAGMAVGLGLVKFHLVLPLAVATWERRRFGWTIGIVTAILIFGAVTNIVPQSFPDRLNFELTCCVRHAGSTGIPARFSQLPIEWWVGLVIVLGIIWLRIALVNRHAAWMLFPVVYPYFLGFDLTTIIPSLAVSRLAPFLYVLIGFPFVLNAFLPRWLIDWSLILGLIIGGAFALMPGNVRSRLIIRLHEYLTSYLRVGSNSEEPGRRD